MEIQDNDVHQYVLLAASVMSISTLTRRGTVLQQISQSAKRDWVR